MNSVAAPPRAQVLGRFCRLGEHVARQWAAVDHAPADFAALATAALLAAQPWQDFDVADLLGAALEPGNVWTRPRTPFSDFPMILYRDARFRVEALIWTNSTTKIHDHGFCGAFAMLQGRSLHSRFVFAESTVGANGCAFGDLATDAVRVLDRGAVITIDPAPDFIHSAFHLDTPTVTLVVRTHGGGGQQREYYAPGVALPSEPSVPRAAMTADALAMLATLDAERAAATLMTLSETADAETVFRVFASAPWSAIDRDIARAAHVRLLGRPWGQSVFSALRWQADADRLFALRALLDAPEERLLLGATALFGDRETVLNLIAHFGIADVVEVATSCIVRAANAGDAPFRASSEEIAAVRHILNGDLSGDPASPIPSAIRAGPFHRLLEDPAKRSKAERFVPARLCGVLQ